MIAKKLTQGEETLAVIGLGYVGLPIALEFAKKTKVIGFDINQGRVDLMKNKIDPSKELVTSDFDGCDIEFTANIEDLKDVKFYIVAVPTPIDEHNLPDLKPLLGASSTVGKVISKGDYVVFESTVYPGCTEEDCVPVLEKESGLKFNEDFKVGYSPERINPGDKEHTLTKIVKVAAGSCEKSANEIAEVYEMIITAGVHRASSIKVAEAAKIIENTQRDVNIALMNELSMIFNKIGINTYEVLEAAGTKWNFLKFFPGLVGGHCIGVDPYYLTYKARELGYHSKIINSGRALNDSMGPYLARQTVKKLISNGKDIVKSRVLVMGATFKEDVSDIRNSKVASVIDELKSFGVTVEVHDPFASSDEINHEYGFTLIPEIKGKYDAVVVAVNHSEYLELKEDYFRNLLTDKGLLVDVKGIYRNSIKELEYLSL
ncbi:MAG: UDP-N-acetyl-D-galactosamine dehydrogenase [Flavobacteriales bacterium]|jgi:UDP-N-acetyl-D-galactosamine dehydrogenase|tara:strand:+ start:816 stop:2108 length:1293 start_codon:yes stop_codon:yes gene_type:complete